MDYDDCKDEAWDDEEIPCDAEHAEYGSVFDERVVDRDVEIEAMELFAVGTRLFDFFSHNSCSVGKTYNLCHEPKECAARLKSTNAHERSKRTGYFVDDAISF